MKTLPILLLGILVAGCGGQDDSWWPLRTGSKWTYISKTGLNSSVEVLEVRSRVPVAGQQGFELVSNGGPSRLVWHRGDLLANRLAGTNFVPALPIYTSGKRTWKGVVESVAGRKKASATIETVDAEFTEATLKLPARKCTVTVEIDKSTRTLTYLYVRNRGLVQHEEFSGMNLNRSLILTKGPEGSPR